MASDRRLLAAAGQVGVLVAGGAAVGAATQGLYASALTAALGGAVLAFGRLERAPARLARLAPPQSPTRALDVPLLRALLNEAPAPLLLLEDRERIRAVNRAARTLFGVEDRLEPAPPELQHALREEAASHRRRLSISVGGAPARLYALSLADLGAPGALRLAALVDVQAEVHAAEADTLRSVLQVLGHELMNSLTPITSLAETAADLLEGEPGVEAVTQAREALAVIGRRSDGLSRFVTGYRALARLPEPRLRAVDLAELAGDVVRLVSVRPEACGVEGALHRPAEPVVRVTDPELLGQALTNLVINAVEAASTQAPPGKVEVTVQALPNGARLEVSDTGPGVPAAEAESIFQPFTTLKTGGSGVGLHLARSAMRSLGGEVALLDPGGRQGRTRMALTL